MRRWVVAAMMAATAQGAWAADLPEFPDISDDAPILRGGITDGLNTTSVNWQGFYVGGHASWSSANMDFTNATQSLTNVMLQNRADQSIVGSWASLSTSSPSSLGFGGFVGYNGQWDDAVVGVEANYTHLADLTGVSANTLPPIIIPGGTGCYEVGNETNLLCGMQLSGAASAAVQDVLTLRGRAGYAIGSFMPYMFGGAALGRVSINRSASLVENDTYQNNTTQVVTYVTRPAQTINATDNNIFAYGYTAGLGAEVMLWGGLFGRAEYEYVKFVSVKDINIQMNTVRLGLGYKF